MLKPTDEDRREAVRLYPARRSMEISYFVKPSLRRQGLATGMCGIFLAALCDNAARLGVKEVIAEAHPKI